MRRAFECMREGVQADLSNSGSVCQPATADFDSSAAPDWQVEEGGVSSKVAHSGRYSLASSKWQPERVLGWRNGDGYLETLRRHRQPDKPDTSGLVLFGRKIPSFLWRTAKGRSATSASSQPAVATHTRAAAW